MKIAVLSDSHDHLSKIDDALQRAGEADAFIHCGDLCSPFVVKRLGTAANGRPVHVVFGNNDGDILLITRVAAGFENIYIHGNFAQIELDGLRIAVNHFPEIARPLAASGSFDLVCYGHNHTRSQEQIGSCILLNPGEIMGMNGPSSFAVVDTADRTVRFVPLP